MTDLTDLSLEALLDLLREDLSEMDEMEIREEIEYRHREEDDGDSWAEEQYENAEFEGADEFYGGFEDY